MSIFILSICIFHASLFIPVSLSLVEHMRSPSTPTFRSFGEIETNIDRPICTISQKMHVVNHMGTKKAVYLALESNSSFFGGGGDLLVGSPREVYLPGSPNNNNDLYCAHIQHWAAQGTLKIICIHLVISTLEEMSLKLRSKFLKSATCSYRQKVKRSIKPGLLLRRTEAGALG